MAGHYGSTMGDYGQYLERRNFYKRILAFGHNPSTYGSQNSFDNEPKRNGYYPGQMFVYKNFEQGFSFNAQLLYT